MLSAYIWLIRIPAESTSPMQPMAEAFSRLNLSQAAGVKEKQLCSIPQKGGGGRPIVFLCIIYSFIFQSCHLPDLALCVQIKAAAARAFPLFVVIYRRAENNWSQGKCRIQDKQVEAAPSESGSQPSPHIMCLLYARIRCSRSALFLPAGRDLFI